MYAPPTFGPSALRYIDYFLRLLRGTGLDTTAKMELLAMVNGFAISYGGVQAALAEQRARTGVTAEQQAGAQVTALVTAAASGRYPDLAAALAGPAPRRGMRTRCSARRWAAWWTASWAADALTGAADNGRDPRVAASGHGLASPPPGRAAAPGHPGTGL